MASLTLITHPLRRACLRSNFVRFLLLLLISSVLVVQGFNGQHEGLRSLQRRVHPLTLRVLRDNRIQFPELDVTEVRQIMLVNAMLVTRAHVTVARLVRRRLLRHEVVENEGHCLIMSTTTAVHEEVRRCSSLLRERVTRNVVSTVGLIHNRVAIQVRDVMVETDRHILPFPFIQGA